MPQAIGHYGSYLSNSTADWTGLIKNGQLPTSLDGVSVTMGGKPAFVYFVSPGQINVQAPATATGDVSVVVTNNGVSTAPVQVRFQDSAPAFFQWGASKYAVTTRYPDNAYVANPSIGKGYVAAIAPHNRYVRSPASFFADSIWMRCFLAVVER
jgi:uncharacterized protein (TIGR03437 family)